MMAVCSELRIPLFLGSSKSLAKSIVVDSMSGRSSEKPLLKELKEVATNIIFDISKNVFLIITLFQLYIFSYQSRRWNRKS